MSFQLDQTFDNDGAIINLDYQAVIISTHIQNSKILSAGYYYNEEDDENYLFMVRYNSTGTLDTTFGTDGFVFTNYTINTGENSKIMFVFSNNKFVVLCKNPNNNNFAFIRYTENGSIDTTFGTDGILNTGYTFDGNFFCSIINDNNDGIVFSYLDTVLKYRRYNSNGSTNGNLTSTVFNFTTRFCLCNTIDSDGNIIFAGRESGGVGAVPNPLLYTVYKIDDTLDTSIGTVGYVYYTHDVNGNQGYSSVITDTDNNIILVANYGDTTLVHKYNTTGTLLYHNRNGIVADGSFTSLNIQSGKILVGAHKDINDDNLVESFYLTRLNSDLTIDTSFGTNGHITSSITITDTIVSKLLNIVIYSNTKIIVSGYIYDDNDEIPRYCILCYSSNDEEDPVFGDLLNDIVNNDNVLEYNVEEFGKNSKTVNSVMGNLIYNMLTTNL